MNKPVVEDNNNTSAASCHATHSLLSAADSWIMDFIWCSVHNRLLFSFILLINLAVNTLVEYQVSPSHHIWPFQYIDNSSAGGGWRLHADCSRCPVWAHGPRMRTAKKLILDQLRSMNGVWWRAAARPGWWCKISSLPSQPWPLNLQMVSRVVSDLSLHPSSHQQNIQML